MTFAKPALSGRTAVLGHTPQSDGKVLDAGHYLCIDTGCGLGGKLTALELPSKTVYQVDERGLRT